MKICATDSPNPPPAAPALSPNPTAREAQHKLNSVPELFSPRPERGTVWTPLTPAPRPSRVWPPREDLSEEDLAGGPLTGVLRSNLGGLSVLGSY